MKVIGTGRGEDRAPPSLAASPPVRIKLVFFPSNKVFFFLFLLFFSPRAAESSSRSLQQVSAARSLRCRSSKEACDAKDGCCPLPRPLIPHFYAFFSEIKLINMFERVDRARSDRGEVGVTGLGRIAPFKWLTGSTRCCSA